MLCESRLWRVVFYTDQENVDPLPPVSDPQDLIIRTGSQSSAAPLLSTPPSFLTSILQASDQHNRRMGYSILPGAPQSKRPCERDSAQHEPPEDSPYQALQPQQRLQPGRQISQQMEIPGPDHSVADAPFLVPPSCQSIVQNYSDLHIGGDQVLPLSAHNGELLPCSESQADHPFVHSCDVPPAVDDSFPNQTPLNEPLKTLRRGSTRLSGRDRSFILQGLEGPLSNSLLNRYLEHKLLDLYQQYMLESMARDGAHGADPGSACPLLGSELVLTSVDHLTLQLSREGNLEAGQAKDMVLSCLLRVASDLGESQISTPLLQISSEGPSRDTQSTDGSEVQSQTEVKTQAQSQSEVESSAEGNPCFDSSDPPVKDLL